MINRDLIYAVAEDGTVFKNHAELLAFKAENSTVFTVTLGQVMSITNKKLVSYGYTGTVIGFDISSKGKPLLLICWNKDAAPIRTVISSVMTRPPKKFWMVIPYNERQQVQSAGWSGSARTNGTSPAVHRFASEEEAFDFIRREQNATRFAHYVVLESTTFVSNGIHSRI